MSDQTYDFSAEKSSNFQSLPEDWYKVKATEPKVTTSTSGNPMITIAWQVTEGDYENRKVFDNLVFSTNSLWKIKKVLEAVKSPLANQSARIQDVAEALKDQELRIYLLPDVKQDGSPTNKIKNYAGISETSDNSLYK